MLDRFDALLNRLAKVRVPWWLWPSALLGLALSAWAASLLLTPGADELCYLGEHPLGGTCAFIALTGQPCPQCGMTRSFVWGARGELVRAATYSPGGLALFLWIQAGGVVGLARLVRRDPRALTVHPTLLVGWTGFWLIALYATPWFLRLMGFNPLP